MSNVNLSELKIAPATKFAVKSTGKGALSLGITYSCNGTRLTLSNGLCSALGLDNEVYIGVSIQNNCIVLSKNDAPNMEHFKLSKKGNIVYNKALVEGIVNRLKLNTHFEKHTSITFQDIEIDDEENIAAIMVASADIGVDELWYVITH